MHRHKQHALRQRDRDSRRDSAHSRGFSCFSSAFEQLHHQSTSSSQRRWLESQTSAPQDCLPFLRNQGVVHQTHHTKHWPCHSAQREPAPSSADPRPVSRFAPCCCGDGRPHGCNSASFNVSAVGRCPLHRLRREADGKDGGKCGRAAVSPHVTDAWRTE